MTESCFVARACLLAGNIHEAAGSGALARGKAALGMPGYVGDEPADFQCADAQEQ